MTDEINQKIKQVTRPKPHVSYSELSMWLECPFRWKLTQLDGLGSSSITPHISFGKALHDANEKYLATRMMDKESAFAIIREDWKVNHDLFMNGPFPDWAKGTFGTVEDWIKKADRILSEIPAFLDKEFPNWECVSAEELLYEQIENHELKFKGYIDGIIKFKNARGKLIYMLLDWKTCGFGWSVDKQRDFNVQLQLILYKTFWSKKNSDINIKDIRCSFVLMKRDAKPGKSISLLPISIGPVPMTKGLRVIDNHIRNVSKGFFPKNRDSCKFCEFAETPHCPPSF
jgi:hypothetical protein